jgi:hypothetical protein
MNFDDLLDHWVRILVIYIFHLAPRFSSTSIRASTTKLSGISFLFSLRHLVEDIARTQ